MAHARHTIVVSGATHMKQLHSAAPSRVLRQQHVRLHSMPTPPALGRATGSCSACITLQRGSLSSPGHFGSLQYSVSIDLVDSGGNFGVDSSLGFTGSGGNCGSGSLSGMKGLHRSAVLVLVLLYFGFPLRNNADLMTLAWP